MTMILRRVSIILTAAALAALPLAGNAGADTADGGGGGWGSLTVAGATQAYTGAVTLNGGFPDVTFTSDSTQVTVASGASTYLNTNTAVGAKYGPSQGSQYFNTRPSASNSAADTTYTFATPTPTSGWTFVLGDIDADAVKLSGTDAAGNPVSPSAFGFAGAFNYCGGSPSPCTANINVPSWNSTTGDLTGTGSDTDGAAAWFEPNVPLKNLTMTFTQQSGNPTYQTWFASNANSLTGTVTGCPAAAGQPAAGVTVNLRNSAGIVVGTTTTSPDGTYGFTGYVATEYTVEPVPGAGCKADPETTPADLRSGDANGVNVSLIPASQPCASGSSGSSGSSTGSSGSSGSCNHGGGSSGSSFGSAEITPPTFGSAGIILPSFGSSGN